MSEYKLNGGKIEEAVTKAYKKIEKAFVDAFINEDGSMKTGGMAEKATGVYQKVEDSVVGAYKKVESAFVNAFLEEIKDDDVEQPADETTATDTVADGDTAGEKKDAE